MFIDVEGMPSAVWNPDCEWYEPHRIT
jgi:hypothetical protein